MPSASWILYGAYGYTGKLIAEEAIRRGHRPLLAGRNRGKLISVAERLGLDFLPVDLNDEATLRNAVPSVDLVLHAAGPFIHTAMPMVEACLNESTHYLDVCGEPSVLRSIYDRHEAALRQNIALLPGAGFDIVPTDCMARHVADQISDIQSLEIAIDALNELSAGTAKASIEALPDGGKVRRDGKIVAFPLGEGKRTVRFPHRERTILPVPLAELESAYQTTGSPNITTYLALPAAVVGMAGTVAGIGGKLLRSTPLRRIAKAAAELTLPGPEEKTRAEGRSYVWVRATGIDGTIAEGWLETMEAYRLTAIVSVRLVEKVLEQQPTGALTPAGAFGDDFILELPETKRYDRLPI